jgi:hypothetical protein
MTMTHRSVVALGALSALAAASNAAIINITGDLGTQSITNGTNISFNPSIPIITPFSQTGANGTVAGDVIAYNPNGLNVSLAITNLTFSTFAAGPGPGGVTDVQIVTHHYFQLAGSLFTSGHALSGTWSTHTNNAITLNSTVDYLGLNLALGTLSGINTGATTSFNFGNNGTTFTPTLVPGTVLFSIQMTLNLRVAPNGNIILPSSADVFVDAVPAPGAGLPRRHRRVRTSCGPL